MIAVLAQRLVRKVCTRCKQPTTLSPAVLADAGIPAELAARSKIVKGKGCPYCQKSGYKGRIGIYELMVVTNKLREQMFANKATPELRAHAIKEGMTTLYCDGIRKVLNGITTLEEVYKTAKRTEQDGLAMENLMKEFV